MPDYPISSEDRLDSHFFVQWNLKRWRKSEFRQLAEPEVEAGLDRLIADPVEALIPARSYVGILDWAYNVGLGAAARSTLIRKLNAGDLRGACDELPRWRFAGGKGIRGLLIRRNKARD
ncbi:glycoside hydrolase family protein, partial [Rhodovulum sulfidophilum]|nr:glycoside hydrolase family protein [Rhodovulum sulfidophilum]